MPVFLSLPIALRAGSAFVFIAAVIIAASLNRSLLMVPLLALASTLVHWGIGRIAPGPLAQLQALAGQSQRLAGGANLFWLRVFGGTIGYGAIFMITVFFSALVQETQLERALTGTDLKILLIASGLAAILAFINAKLAARQVGAMAGDLNTLFAQMRSPDSEDDPFTVEGEIIEPDDTRS